MPESPEARTAKLTKAEERRYEELYHKKWRQLRRWIERGEKAKDPCPLSDPAKMPGWWGRNMTWRCPPEIEEAAVTAARHRNVSCEPVPIQVIPDISVAGGVSVGDTEPLPGVRRSIKLEEFDPVEGARLSGLQKLEAAKFAELVKALADGDADASVLETRYVKLCDTIDKIESRITARMQQRGLLVLREEVDRDLAATAELFRQSRESMRRRVLERCPNLTAELRAEVGTAIDRACDADAKTFAKLNVLKTDDLLADLAA